MTGPQNQKIKSTASKQVKTLNEFFFFPSLSTYRKVSLYLPEEYYFSDKRYPVIYMHDGQHLFDEATAFGKAGNIEWQVDKTINSSVDKCIVVAIDHPIDLNQRLIEYSVSGDNLGWRYLEDIVIHLKRFIDSEYRTLSGPSHTALAGSSMGGLISIYAGLTYPEIFGTIGALSPSLWYEKGHLYSFSQQQASNKAISSTDFYFYVGGQEIRKSANAASINLPEEVSEYVELLKSIYHSQIQINYSPNAKHGALYWQQAFRDFYKYWQTKMNDFK